MLMAFMERRVYMQCRESNGDDEHKEKGNSHAVSLKT